MQNFGCLTFHVSMAFQVTLLHHSVNWSAMSTSSDKPVRNCGSDEVALAVVGLRGRLVTGKDGDEMWNFLAERIQEDCEVGSGVNAGATQTWQSQSKSDFPSVPTAAQRVIRYTAQEALVRSGYTQFGCDQRRIATFDLQAECSGDSPTYTASCLAAVALASDRLSRQQCDIAIVAGTCSGSDPMLSPGDFGDGKRSLNNSRMSGVCVLLLKTLGSALKSHDAIHAQLLVSTHPRDTDNCTECSDGDKSLISAESLRTDDEYLALVKHLAQLKVGGYCATQPASSGDKTTSWREVQSRQFVSSHRHGTTHVNVREVQTVRAMNDPRSHHIVLCSAPDPLLAKRTMRMAEYTSKAKFSLSDLAYTTTTRSDHCDNLYAFIGSTVETLAAMARTPRIVRRSVAPAKVIFLFSENGTQYDGMAKTMYWTSPSCKHLLDECDSKSQLMGMDPFLGIIRGTLPLAQASRSQRFRALVAIEVAIARYFISLGVVPSLVLGSNVGSWAALCVAGAISLEATITLAHDYATIMDASLPVSARSEAPGALDIFGPTNAGSHKVNDEVAGLRDALSGCGLNSSARSTSQLMLARLIEATDDIFFTKPAIPIVSTETGQMLTDQDDLSSSILATGALGPSRPDYACAAAVEYLTGSLEDSRATDILILSIGPSPRWLDNMPNPTARPITTMITVKHDVKDWKAISLCLAKAYILKQPVRWDLFHADYNPKLDNNFLTHMLGPNVQVFRTANCYVVPVKLPDQPNAIIAPTAHAISTFLHFSFLIGYSLNQARWYLDVLDIEMHSRFAPFQAETMQWLLTMEGDPSIAGDSLKIASVPVESTDAPIVYATCHIKLRTGRLSSAREVQLRVSQLRKPAMVGRNRTQSIDNQTYYVKTPWLSYYTPRTVLKTIYTNSSTEATARADIRQGLGGADVFDAMVQLSATLTPFSGKIVRLAGVKIRCASMIRPVRSGLMNVYAELVSRSCERYLRYNVYAYNEDSMVAILKHISYPIG